MSIISPKYGSLSTIIRSFKSAVSKYIHKTEPGFSWQTRFFENIINNKKEFEYVKTYIIDNPVNWID
jgi:putative transposase